MRISDWSSDVCSSDLLQGFEEGLDGRIVVAISLAAHRWTQAIGLQLFFDSRKSNIGCRDHPAPRPARRSEEHTSELQSLMRISYAVFCLKQTQNKTTTTHTINTYLNDTTHH